MVVVHLRRFLW